MEFLRRRLRQTEERFEAEKEARKLLDTKVLHCGIFTYSHQLGLLSGISIILVNRHKIRKDKKG